eukprot:Clim_evm74s128 gene=Clim_evmTU74s128
MIYQLVVSAAAVGLRVLLAGPQWREIFHDRPEVITPLNDIDGLLEGVWLKSNGLKVYGGSVVRQPPTVLYAFESMAIQLDDLSQAWILADVACGLVLGLVAQQFLQLGWLRDQQSKKDARLHKHCPDEVLISAPDVRYIVSGLYMLNPYTIAACSALSLSVWTNLFIALSMFFAVYSQPVLAGGVLAVAAHMDIHNVLLLAPLVIACGTYTAKSSIGFAACVGSFVIGLYTLLVMSSDIVQGWSFVDPVYGNSLQYEDPRPNTGLWWYVTIEVFALYRPFFIRTFQLMACVHVIPLCVRFQEDPMFAMTVLLGANALLKPYVSVSDAALYLPLVAMHPHVLRYCSTLFIGLAAVVFASLLAPIMWYIWIFSGSGNANFYYAITLLYNLGHVVILGDLARSFLRREYDLRNGIYHKLGESVVLS